MCGFQKTDKKGSNQCLVSKMEKEERMEVLEEEEDKKSMVLKEALSWVKVIAFALILTFCLRQFVIVNAEVPTGSMENLIDPGDRLIGFRLAYLFDEPKRFDVIIFEYPVNPDEKFIKRVIGLPGETVDIVDGKIYIDGDTTPLEEDYLPEQWVVNNNGFHYEVPEDCYLVLGDNRNLSLDARYWPERAISFGLANSMEDAEQYAYVSKDAILGKAIFKYYPHLESLISGQDE